MGNEPSNPNFRPVTDEEEEIFQSNLRNINEKVRETFPSIPLDFQLKPMSVRGGEGDPFYDFKIAMPDGKIANVSFNTADPSIDVIVENEKSSKKMPEIKVDPTLTSMLEERIQTVIFY